MVQYVLDLDYYQKGEDFMQRKRWKTAALLLAAAVTAILPVATGSGGTIFKDPEPIIAYADGGAYNNLAVDLATATAFDDARNAIKAASSDEIEDMENNFKANLSTLCGGRFGNVGLLVGPKGTGSQDTWSTYMSKISIDNEQIKAYDADTDAAFSKYKAFGGAVQKLNGKSQKTKGGSASMQKGLDELSAAGAKLTNLGADLLKKYNPAPLVLSMIDFNELNTHPDNELVKLVNANRDLRELFTIMGAPTRFGIPMSFLILFFAIFLLFVTSALMTLINGRSAGENIRKMMVKILIGSVAVPLIAKGLDAGIGFLGNVSLTQANSPEANYVEQNLNLADWYACGFSLPSGTNITIDKDGEFVLTPGQIRAINTFTYNKLWGSPTDEKMMNKMEEYYSMYKAMPMAVNFSEPTTRSGSRQGRPWRTKNFYEALDNFGSNELLTQDLEFVETGSNPDLANIGYFASNYLMMSGSSGSTAWTVSGNGSRYGISPIAATNLMRTTFTGSAMTVTSNSTMGSVVFNADNAPAPDDPNMPSLVRFIATFSMVLAAMKGLFSILTAGFGGILGGSMRSATGSSAGFGQAIGGVIALVGGVFGISVIMTLSFTMVDQLYGVMQNLLSGTTMGASLLDPLRETVSGWIPPFNLLADIFKTGARLILSLLCMITFPKFGGIPVTLFCQFLADLPSRMAEQAQQIENRFTGDFRGGGGGYHGGGMSNANTMINQAANEGRAQLSGVGAGLAMAGGAVAAGFASWKGDKMADKYGNADTGQGLSMSGTGDDRGTQAEPGTTDDGQTLDPNTVDEATTPEDGTTQNEQDQNQDRETENQNENHAHEEGSTKSENMPIIPEAGTDGTMSGSEDAHNGDPLSGDTKENVQLNDDYKEGDSTMSENDSNETQDSSEHSEQETMDLNDSDQQTDSMEVSSEQSMASTEKENAESIENEQYGTDSTMSEQSQMSEHDGGEHSAVNEQAHSEKSLSQNTATGHTNAEQHVLANEHSMNQNHSQMEANATNRTMASNHNSNQNRSTASVRATNQSTVQKNGQSMSTGKNPARTAASGTRPTGARQTMTNPSAARPGTRRTAGMTPGNRSASMTGAQNASTTTEKKPLTQAQRHNKNMQTVAKTLQTLGNHTTKGQVAAGVAAGLTHAAGSAMGVGQYTQKGVSAVSNYKKRQNDIRDGLNARYSQQQQEQNEAAEKDRLARLNARQQQDYDNRQNTRSRNNAQRRPDAVRQQQLYTEELAREAEERQARRQRED